MRMKTVTVKSAISAAINVLGQVMRTAMTVHPGRSKKLQVQPQDAYVHPTTPVMT
jgi:hypothetical protein